MESFDLSLLGVILPQAVGVLLMIAGLVAALTLRARLGSTATGLTVAATGLGALTFLISTWWQTFGLRSVIEEGGGSRYAMISFVSLVLWLLHLVWTGLLIGAVFAGRRRPPVVENAVMSPGSPL
ncbi:hypothetical protein [Catellatospora paridis]|uniref:hypothetical protein n=1 Tax=Catellatospora paridis TaxID=1617086 RepID=UPI0012D3CA13|nr:hypothetical protein [Catellatospora paridis]